MDTSIRQQELNQIIKNAFSNPALKKALDVFQMGQNQYTRALIGMNVATIIDSNSANLDNNSKNKEE